MQALEVVYLFYIYIVFPGDQQEKKGYTDSKWGLEDTAQTAVDQCKEVLPRGIHSTDTNLKIIMQHIAS